MCSLNPVSGAGLAHYILQYCNNTVGYSYNTLFRYIYSYITLTQSVQGQQLASSLIHAVVLCESAQRYRALMVILQSHRTQNMILRCYPNVSATLRRHIKSCLLCFFNNPYIFPLFIHRIFITCNYIYVDNTSAIAMSTQYYHTVHKYM